MSSRIPEVVSLILLLGTTVHALLIIIFQQAPAAAVVPAIAADPVAADVPAVCNMMTCCRDYCPMGSTCMASAPPPLNACIDGAAASTPSMRCVNTIADPLTCTAALCTMCPTECPATAVIC